MARYLDPKNDLTFKKIFGEHPDLLISFLNALMPLDPGQLIEEVAYLLPEQVPETPLGKNSIVDVRCSDNRGRQFIVEMQMYWSELFKNRMVFNASKAYVRQIGKGDSYELLQPVYALGIINDTFDHQTPEFYHHYQTINRGNTNEVIKGLEFVMVELPKFKPEKWSDRKMAVLWLRFLREVRDMTESISPDLLENEHIRKALTICEESAFTSEELLFYDGYWDYISTEKGLADFAKKEGRAEGIAEGKAEGRAEGEAIGRAKEREEAGKREQQKNIQTVINCHRAGIPIYTIAAITGLSEAEIQKITER